MDTIGAYFIKQVALQIQ